MIVALRRLSLAHATERQIGTTGSTAHRSYSPSSHQESRISSRESDFWKTLYRIAQEHQEFIPRAMKFQIVLRIAQIRE